MWSNLNDRKQKKSKSTSWCQFSRRLFLFFSSISDMIELTGFFFFFPCTNHNVMECQGKNFQKASHTAASGTALSSCSLEFQVLRQGMKVKCTQFIFHLQVLKRGEKGVLCWRAKFAKTKQLNLQSGIGKKLQEGHAEGQGPKKGKADMGEWGWGSNRRLWACSCSAKCFHMSEHLFRKVSFQGHIK